MPDSNSALRHELHLIASADPSSIDQHPQLIEELLKSLPHCIRLAPSDLSPKLPIAGYNCFEFALGLAGQQEVIKIARSFSSTYCNSEFIDYLKHTGLIGAPDVSSPELVFYRDSERFTHAGVMQGESVVSKWGRGHVWQHQLWEVPSSYGDSAALLALAGNCDVLSEFVKFAREREGGPIVDEVLASLQYADRYYSPARGVSKDPPARPYYDVAPERTLQYLSAVDLFEPRGLQSLIEAV